MQGALPPHSTLLAFTNIKQTYMVTVDKANSPVLEGPGAYSPDRGPNSAKYAMRGCPPPDPTELGCPITKQASLPTLIVSKQGIFEVAA